MQMSKRLSIPSQRPLATPVLVDISAAGNLERFGFEPKRFSSLFEVSLRAGFLAKLSRPA